MFALDLHETVGSLVARRPAFSRVFEAKGIDYCCGGKKSLEQACRDKNIDLADLLESLRQVAQEVETAPQFSPLTVTLTELADHIERTHHQYLRDELPRLDKLAAKVADVHGGHDSRLLEVRRVFMQMARELSRHTMKEEQILFPMIRELDGSASIPTFHCGSIANPIRQMELEHDEAGDALTRLRSLTDDYTPPPEACNTYRALLDGLHELERDMHIHVHKENSVLFPRAIDLVAKQAGAAAEYEIGGLK